MSTISMGKDLSAIAHSITGLAQLTATYTQKWENFEEIVFDILAQIKENANDVAYGDRGKPTD